MKARIPTQKLPPLVLAYGFSGERQEKLTALLQSLSLPERTVSPEKVGQTVGFLAGYPGFSAQENSIPAPEAECLLLSSLSDKQVDQLLYALRQADLSIPLKALTTPTNQKWSFAQLVEHLEEERRFHQAQKR